MFLIVRLSFTNVIKLLYVLKQKKININILKYKIFNLY
jgi:hypothetical protein